MDMAMESAKKWGGLSASMLKLLAVCSMLIDHIGAAVVARMLYADYNLELIKVYYVLRQIGRTAFPIYCFLLVEGLKHTHSKWKYAARLGAFALLSEIPFDLAFQSKVLEFSYQNVFFTLLIGLVTLIFVDEIRNRLFVGGNVVMDRAVRTLLLCGTAGMGMGLAKLLRTDYGLRGVACILVMYFLRDRKWLQLAASYLTFVLILDELAALPAFLLLALYRGKKGFSCKPFFYGFYPVHLLLLYLACVLLGVAQYPAL